jgi:hypothetical protein
VPSGDAASALGVKLAVDAQRAAAAGQPSPNPTAHLAGVGKGHPLSSMSHAQNLGSVRHPESSPKRRRLSRPKSRLGVAALIGTAATVGLTGLASCTTAANAGGLPTVQARQSDALTDSFGLKVETSSSQGMYGQRAKVESQLRDLGVRHIRTDFFTNNNGQYAYLNKLRADLGITALLTMGRPDGRGGTVSQLVNDAATKVPNAIFAFEGTNEWDILGGRNWAGEVRNQQKNLYTAIKSNPRLKSKPVYGPSMGRDTTYSALGNVSPWMDYANLHTYPGGKPPSNTLNMRLSRSAVNRSNKPVVSTETGYHNLIPTSAGHRPASEQAAAVYYPRLLLEDIRYGMGHTFGFELLDHGSAKVFRDHLGLLRRDWSRKPAFNALRNILHISADPGRSFTPGKLAYSISGAPRDLETQLYQKRDGTFMLYLWRDVSVWDPNSYRTLNVPKANMTVNLAKSSNVRVYRPTTALYPVATAKGTKVSVSAAGEVVVLAIK